MVKLFVYAMCFFGCLAIITAWFPSAYTQGFDIKGHNVPWAVPMIMGGLYLVYTLKAK